MSGTKVIDVVLQLKNNITGPLESASRSIQAHSRQWQRVGRSIQRTGRSIERVGSSLTRSVTVPIVGLGTLACKKAIEFEKEMANVNTLLDDHSHLQGYEKAVKNVSNTYGIAATDVSKGMYQLVSVTGDHGTRTTKMFNTIAKAAKAGGAEVIDTVNMVSAAMNGYASVNNKTAKTVSDLAFKAVKIGKTSFPEMANAMASLFPNAHSLNISMQELFATMATTTLNTKDSAEASTQIKGIMSALLKPSKDMANLYDQIGVKSGRALIKQRGLVGALETIQKAAGKDGLAKYFRNVRALSGANTLLSNDMKRLKSSMDELNGAAGATGNALSIVMDTNAAKFEKVKNKLMNTLTDVGAALLPKVVPVIEKVADAIGSVLDKFNAMTEEEQDHILKIIATIATIGPVLSIIGKVTIGIGTMIKALSGISGIFKGIGAAIGFITSPAGLVVAAIAGVVTVIVLLIKNWDKVKKAAQVCWEAIKKVAKGIADVVSKAVGVIVSVVKTVISVIGSILKTIYDVIVAIVSKIVEVVMGILTPFIEGIKAAINTIGAVIGTLWDTVSGVFNGIKEIFGGIIDFIAGIFTLNWEKAWEGVKSIFGGIWDGIVSVVKGAINLIIDIINGAIWGINAIISGVNWVADWIPGVGDSLIPTIPEIPHLASGTQNWSGGIVQIHERGGEIVDLPRGSRVYPHDESVRTAFRDGMMASGGSRKINITIPKLADQIVVREEADIKKVARRLADELEKTAQNLGGNQISYSFQS